MQIVENDVEQLLPNAQIKESRKDFVLDAANLHSEESDQLNSIAYFPIDGSLLCRKESRIDYIEIGSNKQGGIRSH